MKRTILSLLIFSAAACGIIGPDKVTLRFEGTVTAQATGQPIAGAQVRLFEPTILFGSTSETLATTTTDAQGNYSLSASVTDNCVGAFFGLAVGVTASGFAAEGGKEVTQCNGSLQRIDFALAPATIP